MKTIIENLQALVDSVEFAETEYKANYVITTQDKKLLTEALNQALHLHGVMQAEGSDGVNGAAVGNSAAGQSGRDGCVHNTLNYIGPWYSCKDCGTHFEARAEAPSEGALDF
jgi:hypothetical protein